MFPGRGATPMDDLSGFARVKLAEGDGLRVQTSFKDATSKYKDAIGKADGA